MRQQNLFEEKTVTIRDNPSLESIANLILRLVDMDPDILEGDRIGEIDRKLRLAVWMEQGLAQIITSDQMEVFQSWALDPAKCVDPELVRRARQYLVQHDHIRLPADAIRDGERQRARLTKAFKS